MNRHFYDFADVSKIVTEQISSQVIIVSCHEEFEMVKEAMRLGACDYLRKLNLSAGMKVHVIFCLEIRKRMNFIIGFTMN